MALPDKDAALKSFIGHVDVHWSERNRMRDWCETRAAEILSQNGLIVDEASHARLAKAVAAAMQQAARVLQQNMVVSHDFATARQQSASGLSDAAALRPKVCFKELLDGWAKETKPAAKTIYTWTRVFDQLAKFLGHDDAQRVTVDDIIRWKGALVEGGLKAKSVRDSCLAPVRAVLGWGANNRKLPQNVAERVTIDVKSKPSERRRGYTDEEAALLLRDARSQKTAHRRWVPWLYAYTGARVSEICQLRVEDVRQVEGIWSLHITADAGSVKNAASERLVPLHSAIVSEGFLDFVQSQRPCVEMADLA